ncbi:hypothetical protein DL764_001612 [Monosporascus ibericus]|uniref:Heterokaryon incompatibility domain-containing protein n=1 Tax=Monosporascus ibericus TaxID=155417 RepID=A0A4Q4TQH9_9PEZI|nr:hypothetical protein DL764_001612 [Monosporascus ibericus]
MGQGKEDEIGNPASIYKNVPIDSSEQQIRLLTLHPGDWSSEIQCSLVTASLASKPKFRALSYVWGDDPPTCNIRLNEETALIRFNLESALRRLRRSSGGEKMTLWVDAVCINQGDEAEINAQIKLFTLIYAGCQDVFVWLGEYAPQGCGPRVSLQHPTHFLSRDSPKDETKALLERYVADFRGPSEKIDYSFHVACLLFLLSKSRMWNRRKAGEFISRPQPPYWTEMPGVAPQGQVEWSETAVSGKDYTDRLVQALEAAQQSKWWTRVWVLQEFAVSPKVFIGFGTAAVNMGDIPQLRKFHTPHKSNPVLSALNLIGWAEALNFVQARQWVKVYRGQTADPSDSLLMRAFLLVPLSFRKFLVPGRMALFDAVAQGRCFDSRNPRDRVYPVAILMKWIGLDPKIEIDSKIEPRELYRRVSMDQINHWHNHLNVYEPLAPLRFSRLRNEVKNLPSWAVDWTSYGSVARDHGRLTVPRYYQADKGMSLPRPAAKGDILKVSGVRVGAITNVIYLSRDSCRRTWHEIERWLQAPSPCEIWACPGTHAEDSRSPEILRPEAMLRTLCLDMPERNRSAYKRWALHWDYVASLVWQSCDEIKKAGTDASLAAAARCASNSLGLQKGDPNHPLPGAPDIFYWMSLGCREHSLFCTEEGYLGIGGPGTDIGDEVWVLYGGRTPFVLARLHLVLPLWSVDRYGSRYHLESECYVDGFMYGEAASKDLQPKSIEIE